MVRDILCECFILMVGVCIIFVPVYVPFLSFRSCLGPSRMWVERERESKESVSVSVQLVQIVCPGLCGGWTVRQRGRGGGGTGRWGFVVLDLPTGSDHPCAVV